MKLLEVRDRLAAELGRLPTADELAEASGQTPAVVRHILKPGEYAPTQHPSLRRGSVEPAPCVESESIEPTDAPTLIVYTWPAGFDHIPASHGYQLCSALSHHLQPVHEGSWQVCPLSGRRAEGRWLFGPGTLRLRGPLAPVMLGALNGEQLVIGRSQVQLGRGVVSEAKPAATLVARYVTVKNATDEDAMLRHVVAGCQRMIGRIPEIEIGRRRIMSIAGRKVVGFGVRIAGLDDAESLRIQATGIGGRRRMGAGIFEPELIA